MTIDIRALKRIADIKDWRDATPLTTADRRVVDGGLALIEAHWKTQKRNEHKAGMDALTEQHNELVSQAGFEKPKELKKLRDDVKSGRITAAAARGMLRDYLALHQRLTEQHLQLEANDDVLDELDTMSLQDYQDSRSYDSRFHDRFPVLRAQGISSDPTFGAAIDEYAAAHRS